MGLVAAVAVLLVLWQGFFFARTAGPEAKEAPSVRAAASPWTHVAVLLCFVVLGWACCHAVGETATRSRAAIAGTALVFAGLFAGLLAVAWSMLESFELDDSTLVRRHPLRSTTRWPVASLRAISLHSGRGVEAAVLDFGERGRCTVHLFFPRADELIRRVLLRAPAPAIDTIPEPLRGEIVRARARAR